MTEKIFKQLFCFHKLKLKDSHRYNVLRMDGTKTGEVTIALFECKVCGVERLVASDETNERT